MTSDIRFHWLFANVSTCTSIRSLSFPNALALSNLDLSKERYDEACEAEVLTEDVDRLEVEFDSCCVD